MIIKRYFNDVFGEFLKFTEWAKVCKWQLRAVFLIFLVYFCNIQEEMDVNWIILSSVKQVKND